MTIPCFCLYLFWSLMNRNTLWDKGFSWLSGSLFPAPGSSFSQVRVQVLIPALALIYVLVDCFMTKRFTDEFRWRHPLQSSCNLLRRVIAAKLCYNILFQARVFL